MFKTYRKKPVTVQAVQLNQRNVADLTELLGTMGCKVSSFSKPPFRQVSGINLVTSEGSFSVEYGHWIIIGTKQEVYPCSPEVFSEIYSDGE